MQKVVIWVEDLDEVSFSDMSLFEDRVPDGYSFEYAKFVVKQQGIYEEFVYLEIYYS